MYSKFYASTDQILNQLQLKEYVSHWKAHEAYSRLNNLNNYYKSKNTAIMNRVLENSDINNKIATGYAKYICDVATGYFVGKENSISYVFDNDAEEFQRILKYNDSVAVDKDLALSASIYGYGIEQYYLDGDSEFRFKSIDPRNVIVFFDGSIEENITQVIKYREYDYVDEKGLTREKLIIEYYTMDTIYEYVFIDNALYEEESSEMINIFGDIPFTVYDNPSDMADFEGVISLIDAIDKSMADTSNNLDYYSNAYIIFKHCDIPISDDENDDPGLMLKTTKGFQIPNADGDIYFLEKPKMQDDAINYATDLEKKIFKFSMVPDLTSTEYLQAQSGVAQLLKLQSLEFLTANKEALFRKGLFRRLEIMSNIKNIEGKNIDFTEIEIRFSRNTVTSIDELVDTAIKLKDIISKESLLEMIPVIDKDVELERLKAEKEANMIEFELMKQSNNFFPEEEDEEEDEPAVKENMKTETKNDIKNMKKN